MPFQSLVNQTMLAQENAGNPRARHNGSPPDELVQMYEDGVKVADIVKVSGRNVPSLYNHLRNAGVQLRGLYRLSDETKREIVMKSMEGLTYSEISRELDVSLSAVARTVRAAKLKKEQQK